MNGMDTNRSVPNMRFAGKRAAEMICDIVPSLVTIPVRAELGRAPAVVKVTSQVNRNTQFSGFRRSKTISATKIKNGTIRQSTIRIW